MTEVKGQEEPDLSTKGYLEQMSLEETDTQELIESSDSSDSSDGRHSPTALGSSSSQPRRHSTRRRVAPKWWCLHPVVKRNPLIVIGAWFLLTLGILCFVAGIVLEILFHTASVDVFRGFILVIVAVVLLIPSVYAVTHIYLAAKRVGRVRMSSVWFFR